MWLWNADMASFFHLFVLLFGWVHSREACSCHQWRFQHTVTANCIKGRIFSMKHFAWFRLASHSSCLLLVNLWVWKPHLSFEEVWFDFGSDPDGKNEHGLSFSAAVLRALLVVSGTLGTAQMPSQDSVLLCLQRLWNVARLQTRGVKTSSLFKSAVRLPPTCHNPWRSWNVVAPVSRSWSYIVLVIGTKYQGKKDVVKLYSTSSTEV